MVSGSLARRAGALLVFRQNGVTGPHTMGRRPLGVPHPVTLSWLCQGGSWWDSCRGPARDRALPAASSIDRDCFCMGPAWSRWGAPSPTQRGCASLNQGRGRRVMGTTLHPGPVGPTEGAQPGGRSCPGCPLASSPVLFSSVFCSEALSSPDFRKTSSVSGLPLGFVLPSIFLSSTLNGGVSGHTRSSPGGDRVSQGTISNV